LAENDFVIIDFEGEPARPLAKRRIKHSSLKDVAGMLRSFNYAAYAALFRLNANHPSDSPRLEPLVNDWERQAVQAFLAGYEKAIRGCPTYPAERDHARGLIELFALEKALYELRYELDNRPDWVGIPLKGILALLRPQGPDQPSGSSDATPGD
jgi:maltose alpha-D-glucosyltransferase/alpha-amylase